MDSTAAAACAPARLSGLHVAPSPVARRHVTARGRRLHRESTTIQGARGCCRLRTNNGSRHCSLRVLQSVVGENAAPPHTPSAGRGRCAIQRALDKHLPSSTVPTGSWFSRLHHDNRPMPCVNFGPCYTGQRGSCSDIFRSVIEPRSLYHQVSVWRLVPFSSVLYVVVVVVIY